MQRTLLRIFAIFAIVVVALVFIKYTYDRPSVAKQRLKQNQKDRAEAEDRDRERAKERLKESFDGERRKSILAIVEKNIPGRKMQIGDKVFLRVNRGSVVPSKNEVMVIVGNGQFSEDNPVFVVRYGVPSPQSNQRSWEPYPLDYRITNFAQSELEPAYFYESVANDDGTGWKDYKIYYHWLTP